MGIDNRQGNASVRDSDLHAHLQICNLFRSVGISQEPLGLDRSGRDKGGLRRRGCRVPFAHTYRSFPVPHAFFMPPLAVCQGVHRFAVPARFARWIPDTPDAVDDCIASGANGGGTPGGGPPTTRHALAAAAARYTAAQREETG
jgi:hypothetical protein